MNHTIVFDIEVAFQPEITKMVKELGVDEKKLSWHIDANMRYVTHISYKIDKQKVVDLSLLDYKGSLVGDANEKALLADFIAAYNSCSESVAHYGSKFDIRFLNSRIARYGLPRLKPMVLRDTWRTLKDKFALVNNRLDTAIQFFNCPYGKPSLQWDIWRKVSLGDKAAHKILRNRCHYDVLSLAWIYYNKLKIYNTGRINKSATHTKHLVNDDGIKELLIDMPCPECDEVGSLKREGYAPTRGPVKLQLSCRKCFGWSRAPLLKDGLIGPAV